MANDTTKLLKYIVQNMVVPVDTREAQLDASAVQDVPSEMSAIAADSMGDADRLAPYFERGLALAKESGGRVTVDDTDPEGNGIADAFARFLVTSNLAASQSTELGQGHYRYIFDVDMQRLGALAQQADVQF